jgi:hypothetical protein
VACPARGGVLRHPHHDAAASVSGQLAIPGSGRKTARKRKRPAPTIDPRLAAYLADRDAWLAIGGQLAWRQEQDRRRAALVARLRERRRNGYRTDVRKAA